MTAPNTTSARIPLGIAPLDERTGGIDSGGSYLVVGAPGPAKMVAALQFLHAGLARDEPGLLITNAHVDEMLAVARAWGVNMDDAWEQGRLQVIGFRDDFELRAIRTIAPEEILEELAGMIRGQPARIAVDPGSLFLTGGAKTLLGTAFIAWVRKQRATKVITFSVDGDVPSLPSAADWLVTATTARLMLARRSDNLFQITVAKAVPGTGERDETVTLELKPGEGLIKATSFPSRRGADRGGVDNKRLLLVSLGGSHAADLEAWGARAFDSETVSEPFAAVTKLQAENTFGCVLVYAQRARIKEAIQACRALRPLTRASVVFASDDAIRSTDRIQILEAGADDCLSGGIDFRELSIRIKQSMAAGAKPAVAPGASVAHRGAPPAGVGGRLSPKAFADEVSRRAADADLTFFCVLSLATAKLSAEKLADNVTGFVRTEEGDLVSAKSDRCIVLLQGARPNQLDAFLTRLRARIDESAGGSAGLSIDVLSHPADATRIHEVLEASNGRSR